MTQPLSMATASTIYDYDNSVNEEVQNTQGPLENIGEEPTVYADLRQEHEHPADHLFPQNKLSILLIGKTGVGKSTLVNNFLDAKVCKIRRGAIPTNHEPIEVHTANVAGVDVTIYDTRGLHDPRCSTCSLMHEFKKHCKEVDIVFICHDMISRMDDTAVCTSQILAKAFNEKIWGKCIFVLTKVNLHGSLNDDYETKTELAMKQLMQQYCSVFYENLIKSGVPKAVAEDIPVCVAGNKKNLKLPGFDNWINYLFHACSMRCLTASCRSSRAIEEIRSKSIKAGAISGALAGGAVTMVTVVGIPFGLTIGALIGAVYGDRAFKKYNEELLQKKPRQENDYLIYGHDQKKTS